MNLVVTIHKLLGEVVEHKLAVPRGLAAHAVRNLSGIHQVLRSAISTSAKVAVAWDELFLLITTHAAHFGIGHDSLEVIENQIF
jgi:hypothetical protein